MSREIMKQALHHLVDLADDLRRIPSDIAQTIAALEAELAQPEHRFDTPESHSVKWSIPVDPNNFGKPLAKPEQEPVAWMTNSEHEYSIEYKFNWLQTPLHDIPLYTAPPRKEWIGLTSDDWENTPNTGKQGCERDAELFDWIEQTLKDKNEPSRS